MKKHLTISLAGLFLSLACGITSAIIGVHGTGYWLGVCSGFSFAITLSYTVGAWIQREQEKVTDKLRQDYLEREAGELNRE